MKQSFRQHKIPIKLALAGKLPSESVEVDRRQYCPAFTSTGVPEAG